MYHFIVILLIIILSQILIPIINNRSTDKFLNKITEIYRWDVAERNADQTTASLELLFQRLHEIVNPPQELKLATIEAVDMIIFQQKMQRSVDDFCIILGRDDNIIFYEDGARLYDAIIPKNQKGYLTESGKRPEIKEWYSKLIPQIYQEETIQYRQKTGSNFEFLVPFAFRGEVIGAVYMKIKPEFELFTSSMLSSFRQSGLIFSFLIVFGLLGMFLMTSFLVHERDLAQELVFKQREIQLAEEIETRKEATFVRRIYHAHHKVEKIIGFAKEDLLSWPQNIKPEISFRVNKYINFIGRVIYGMKTANPPVQVIRNPMFHTDINNLLKFIVDNIFRRVYKEGDQYIFNLNRDESCPVIHINEYVAWEIFEPLINNAIEHNKKQKTIITISTEYIVQPKQIYLEISDDGIGLKPEFLEKDKNSIQKIFREKTSIKEITDNSGYGCFIAYESCRRCGWNIEAANNEHGAKFTITIPVS